MLANNFSTSTCSAIFDLIKFMGFGSTLSYPHEEFLISRPPRTRSKFKPLPPRSKFNPRRPALARLVVRVPAPAQQMRIPARAG